MFNALIDLLMSRFRPLPAEVGLVCYGAMTGLLALLIFKVASRPARIVRARNRVLARVVELWLYRHDPLLGLRSIGWMLIDNLRYLAALLPPMAICLLPLCLLFAQGRDWLAFRALKPGETMLVVARLRPDAPITVLNDSELIVDGTTLAPKLREFPADVVSTCTSPCACSLSGDSLSSGLINHRLIKRWRARFHASR